MDSTITETIVKCYECGGSVKLLTVTTLQPPPFPPISTTYVHVCENCCDNDDDGVVVILDTQGSVRSVESGFFPVAVPLSR